MKINSKEHFGTMRELKTGIVASRENPDDPVARRTEESTRERKSEISLRIVVFHFLQLSRARFNARLQVHARRRRTYDKLGFPLVM